jgi:hypothetical protein
MIAPVTSNDDSHRKRGSGRLWMVVGPSVCILIFGGYLWLVNQFPRAQRDDSGLGESPIARRVRGLVYAGPDDWKSEQLTSDIARWCPYTDVERTRACAAGLGMTCLDGDPVVLVCTYHGVVRTRMLNGRGPDVRRWWRGSVTVTLTYTPPGPATMQHSTLAGFENEAP